MRVVRVFFVVRVDDLTQPPPFKQDHDDNGEAERDQEVKQPEHEQRGEYLELRHARHRLNEEKLEHAKPTRRVRSKRRGEGGEKYAEYDEEAGIASLRQGEIDDPGGTEQF